MPSSIRPGCKVEALVGPKRIVTVGDKIGIPSEKEKRTRTARSIVQGWVVGPGRLSSPKNSWRVLWSNCGKTCDHPHSKLTVINDVVHSFEAGVFERLYPEDYFSSTKALYTLMDSGRFDCMLRVTPTTIPARITSKYTLIRLNIMIIRCDNQL